jgi:hypothetical protein
VGAREFLRPHPHPRPRRPFAPAAYALRKVENVLRDAPVNRTSEGIRASAALAEALQGSRNGMTAGTRVFVDRQSISRPGDYRSSAFPATLPFRRTAWLDRRTYGAPSAPPSLDHASTKTPEDAPRPRAIVRAGAPTARYLVPTSPRPRRPVAAEPQPVERSANFLHLVPQAASAGRRHIVAIDRTTLPVQLPKAPNRPAEPVVAGQQAAAAARPSAEEAPATTRVARSEAQTGGRARRTAAGRHDTVIPATAAEGREPVS